VGRGSKRGTKALSGKGRITISFPRGSIKNTEEGGKEEQSKLRALNRRKTGRVRFHGKTGTNNDIPRRKHGVKGAWRASWGGERKCRSNREKKHKTRTLTARGVTVEDPSEENRGGGGRHELLSRNGALERDPGPGKARPAQRWGASKEGDRLHANRPVRKRDHYAAFEPPELGDPKREGRREARNRQKRGEITN